MVFFEQNKQETTKDGMARS